MAHINSPAQIKKIMAEHDLIFHKGLGQNFLFDEHYLNSIVDSGDITKEDVVIEIGPGLGVLTTRLAEKAQKVYAIEIDSNIANILPDITSEYNNIEVINQDVMKFDLNAITSKHTSVKIVANLPYYITTPIVMKILEETNNIKSIVIMIQKEVAQRLVANQTLKIMGQSLLRLIIMQMQLLNSQFQQEHLYLHQRLNPQLFVWIYLIKKELMFQTKNNSLRL